MNHPVRVTIGILIVLSLAFFACRQVQLALVQSSLIFYSQVAVLIMMFFTLIFAAEQINELKSIEKNKSIIAIDSLIQEIKYNLKLLDEYIEHSENGANINEKDGKISWEWNGLRQTAYEQYLTIACKEHQDLSSEITTLYDKLESCNVIIKAVQHFVAVNLIEAQINPLRDRMFKIEISQRNHQLYEISKEAKELIPDLLAKLEDLKK